ncbi:alpha-xylosidase [Paenibacillus macerans]|uniref:alpha-xylosidase n=1 Tax=Paenibacillus macerans TaxID=44252 RepID=UPI003D317D48
MKFTNGFWDNKKGFKVLNPMDVRDIEREDGKVRLHAACRQIRHKGDTLNGPMLTAEFSSPMPDVIRVQWTHYAGKRARGPKPEWAAANEGTAVFGEDEHTLTLTSGGLQVAVNKAGIWGTEFSYAGRKLTGTYSRGTGHITTNEGEIYFREQLDLGVGEHIYGLGERFTHFVKNGQEVDIWNLDGGTGSKQAYKNIPFYLSSNGYGVFVNEPGYVSFEVGSELVTKVQFSVPGEELDYYVIGGRNLKEILRNYTALTGRPALPPAWSFGLWLTTSFTTDYDEATVNHFVDGMAERDIPLHVFHFDCFWMREYRWCDFEWDPAVFPDPEAMLTRLKNKGLKICVWINSYIGQKSPLFQEGMERGYLLKTPDGDVWQWDMWQAGMGLVDFTKLEATEWYKNYLRRLLDMGVDCFKTDFGERIPTDVAYFDGSDPERMHNYYTFLYNKAVFEVLKERRGEREAVVFARSATTGSQQYPVHWGGDSFASYGSMAESLRGGLSLGLSGFGFWSHDIGGFASKATPDMYKRWVAFGLLSSHSRLHGNDSYRVPWLFDEEAVEVLREFTKLKCTLMPYLYAYAAEAAETGLPVMRAMVLEFPGDRNCHPLDMQYMLGERLLVAPIFNDEGRAEYYVPEGKWTHYLSGKVVEGGRWYREIYDYHSLPFLVRPNSLIAVGAVERKPDYDYADGVTFHLFELEDGSSAEAKIWSTEGVLQGRVAAKRTGNVIVFEAEGLARPYGILLRGISEVDAVEGSAAAVQHPLGVLLCTDSSRLTVELAG